MFEALIVTLREGIEAALVVGIIVAFLRKEGATRYLGTVWAGIAAAVAGSLAGAWLLYRVAVNEEAFEGVLYMTSAVMVASLVIWMWRHSRSIAGEMKSSLSRILARERSGAVSAGLFLFTFFMVAREGIETVLFLSAVSLTTNGLLAFLGAAIGIAAAVVFGVLFVRGSVRIDLGRFFKITGIALMIFVVQLLINGYHELSEAGWVPADARTMALIGPLVQNDFFFIAAVVLLPLLMLLIPGKEKAAPAAAEPAAEHAAAARLERADVRRQARARSLGAVLGIAILVVLGLGFVYTRPPASLSPATPLQLSAGGEVRIPMAGFRDGRMQRFVVDVNGKPVRFIAVPVTDGEVATALDACLICGPRGYYQEGINIHCLHCGSAIFPPSIGQPGGCNPIPLPSRVEGGELVLAAADLAAGGPVFAPDAAAGHAGHSM